jgi:tripartite-type tricarboxylate transporter receptor subunit TctC
MSVNWLRYGCAIWVVAAAATFGAPGAALAQDYPTRPIRLVVVTAASGLMDVAARVTAEYVGKALDQGIVIENRAGGGGNLGAEAIAKAPPDGYTIGLIQLGNVAINPHVYADMTFDPWNDLVPVAPVTNSPILVVANAITGQRLAGADCARQTKAGPPHPRSRGTEPPFAFAGTTARFPRPRP